MPALLSGRTSAAATSSPATASACTTALDIRSVRYSGYACASTPLTTAFVDAGLAEPLGGQPGVVGRVVAGVVLVEVVEQPGQTPQVLVLAEAPGEPAHHALDRDQVPDRGLLQALLAAQGDGGLAVHQPAGTASGCR